MQPYRVGILGATGVVGQRLIERLHDHPWFELRGLGASERSAGRAYADAVSWGLSSALPGRVAGETVRTCDPESFLDCDLLFSALDRGVALELEPAFADRGFPIVSNSSAFRQHPEVPLMIPEVNPEHLALVDRQRVRRSGFIVTNPNCSATGLAMAIAPLHRAFGVRRLFVATMQAVSGAGASGPSALSLVDNVIPYIPSEEEKLEEELHKLLGRAENNQVVPAEMVVSAQCHRVPTLDGHLEAVSVEFDRPVAPEAATAALREWRGGVAGLGLPTAPEHPVEVREQPDRPQPRLDRDAGEGMSAVVGRMRPCSLLHLKFLVLSHNAIRGAAGGTVLNAELLAERDMLPRGIA